MSGFSEDEMEAKKFNLALNWEGRGRQAHWGGGLQQ